MTRADLRPIITETVQGTIAQMRALARNPHTLAITDIQQVGPDRVTMTIQRTGVEAIATPLRDRLPFTVELSPGGRTALRVSAWIAFAVGSLFGSGMLIWALWGDEITAAIKLILIGGALILSGAAIGSVVIAKTGHIHCPGLHCPGCKGGGH